ncbi:galactitol-1-phosphate 5-dehydrogenase [Halobacillus litoralis]|uniref:galactitol-1-phosphate 5-dehydrogenase n=1 Tax=Halobacillus litoralis TaxID=45668 RepID=UPI001CFF1509|nr:galactitol-1-phosphate 5-dehydrogenase [Halobacillus litoralis]WLR46623.1 galactitol-1-phosphate 5-dehydrogenase [Halobacillus litoralis]
MKALVLEDKQEFSIKQVDKPSISTKEVLIKVAYCGVCGSDLARYFEGKVHNFPLILGHEFSGIVEEVGEAVQSVKNGDRVAIAPLVPCGDCTYCKQGSPALCNEYSFVGSRQDGAMSEYVSVPAQNLLVLPEGVSNKEAALLEPLTVAIHGIERVHVKGGAEVVVFGAGTIGIMTLLALKARGAGNITVVDINDEKLAVAQRLGAKNTINSSKVDLNEHFSEFTRPEVVFETAGVSQTQVQSVEIVEKLGKVVYIGTASSDVTYPAKVFERILRGEIEITGSWMSYSAPFPGYEWKAALQYIKDGVIDVNPLINHIYHLEQKEVPFDQMRDPENHSIKFLYQLLKE